MRHPLKNFLIWEADWRTWLPGVLFAAFLIYMALTIAFDPGPAPPPPAK